MKKVNLLIAISFLLLFGCEKQPTVVKEVFCYDCYRHTIEVGQEVTQIGSMILSTDTVYNSKKFIMTVCMTPEDMDQIKLYEGESSLTIISSPPTSITGTLYKIRRTEKIECE